MQRPQPQQLFTHQRQGVGTIVLSKDHGGDGPMMILLILVLLGLLLVAGFLAYWVIEERSDETWWPGGRKPRTPTRLSGYLRLRR
jgi:hypothetical protein